ncbi:MAG: YkgJ family cysteine cluster protein [Nanoarchaeota archaeon]
MEFVCNKKESCKQCGRCCHIRDKPIMTPEEDLSLRNRIYNKVGILYLYPLSRYTISITEDEKKIFEKLAVVKKIKLKIIPKKIKLVLSKHVVLDWSLDHDVCPFFDDTLKSCSVYNLRPEVCKVFPNNYSFKNISGDDSGEKAPFEDVLLAGEKQFNICKPKTI